jgi:SET domain-containing protein
MTGQRRHDPELQAVVYVDNSPIHGSGLFAARDIAAGSYIGTFHGPETDTDGEHVLWVYGHDGCVAPVGRRGENVLRFLNHAAPCNAEFDGFDLYALSAIRQGDEITINYEGVE